MNTRSLGAHSNAQIAQITIVKIFVGESAFSRSGDLL
jgi:hypothetical protein